MGIFRKRKLGTPLSGVLNILGMTVAFAALYIILVQVHHDLTYIRRSRMRTGSIAYRCRTGTRKGSSWSG